VLPGVLDLIASGIETSGGSRNRRDLLPQVKSEVDHAAEILLCDPQTSGGLLIALPGDNAQGLIAELGNGAVAIGRVSARAKQAVVVLGPEQ
jgi:selenide,water dikinase